MNFLTTIDCANCKGTMRIESLNIKKKKVNYKCKCGDFLSCEFQLVGMKEHDEIFDINEKGEVTYKCKCGTFVKDTLTDDVNKNKRIYKKAYLRKCDKCFK